MRIFDHAIDPKVASQFFFAWTLATWFFVFSLWHAPELEREALHAEARVTLKALSLAIIISLSRFAWQRKTKFMKLLGWPDPSTVVGIKDLISLMIVMFALTVLSVAVGLL